MPGPLEQSVASPIADPGVVSSIVAWPQTFVENDHEKFSAVFYPCSTDSKRAVDSMRTKNWLMA